jgi:hypothetical protein
LGRSYAPFLAIYVIVMRASMRTHKITTDEELAFLVRNFKLESRRIETLELKRNKHELDKLKKQLLYQDDIIKQLRYELSKKSVPKQSKTEIMTRALLNKVLAAQLRAQFPNDSNLQEHVAAIRQFCAGYINAVVQSAHIK